MSARSGRLVRAFLLLISCAAFLPAASLRAATWSGVVRDASGNAVRGASVSLHSLSGARDYVAKTSAQGEFVLDGILAGSYTVSVTSGKRTWKAASPIEIKDGMALTRSLRLGSQGNVLEVLAVEQAASTQATGGEHLTSGEVSSLPLNTRDFSKLLLLAAGTMTDTNGAANFTQQFAVNGQRGTATVFAMDGIETTDPEMGGATFSNFNVDAIKEVEGNSGVMPAEIGHGAASYTNVITKSGTNRVHGSVFEFVRNAAFDARNFFDRKAFADSSRIPPFHRNEFGFTNGGPVVLPGLYNGRDRTFYFGEYQGFRQVLGTTQVFPVPTLAERSGLDTTAFPGDTLIVPVNPQIAPLLARYPKPNDPQGAFGARTYATSSKVFTGTDQFSIRLDHRLSDRATLYTRFSLNQITGPTTNPDQTVLDPSFGIQFFDHQRNAGLKYSRVWSPHLSSTTSLGYIRSTPFFPEPNLTQPGLGFGDGLFEGFNAPGGTITGSYSNLWQFRHDMVDIHGRHTFKWGVEMRFNRDSTIWGMNINGHYTFGGGPAYSPVAIASASGTHNLQPGDPLPDSLTGLLTATPYSYTISAASDLTPNGDRFNEAAVRRQAYGFYFQDSWKATDRLMVNYGLRYEVNSRIGEANKRTSVPRIEGSNGQPVASWTPGARLVYLENPQPPYVMDWNGWGPRLAVDFRANDHTTFHAGGAIVTMLHNLWQDNFLTGGVPLMVTLLVSARPGVAVPYSSAVVPVTVPAVYTPQGQPVFPDNRTELVPPNTPIDLARLQSDLAALTPGGQVQLISGSGIDPNFRNGYIGTYTAGVEHTFGDLKFNGDYVATVGVGLPMVCLPNGYTGASPAYAPFTQFNAAGQAIGGIGQDSVACSGGHSTYHAFQTSLSKNSTRAGLGFQASYTFSKSLDNTSSMFGQPLMQDPRNPGAEKGPSTFDVTHVFAVSFIQRLPFDRLSFLSGLGKPLTAGWQLLNITTLMTGSPFTVYSGIQQTGAGEGGADRPNQIARPVFSTSRTIREDYFGRGANNASYFQIPIHVPGGTGPNQGVFGTLGRNTFRGPGFRNFDFALIKDTPFGRRGKGELGILQFRAEFFNLFNLVNFGNPSNIVRGSGFGIISSTSGSSRQIQFSLRLVY